MNQSTPEQSAAVLASVEAIARVEAKWSVRCEKLQAEVARLHGLLELAHKELTHANSNPGTRAEVAYALETAGWRAV